MGPLNGGEILFILLGFTAVLVGLILLIHRVLKVDEPDEHGEGL